MQIEELKLSVRAYNCLKRKRYDTVEQVQYASDEELLNIRGLGVSCLKEIREACSVYIQQVPREKTESIHVAEELRKAIKILNEEYEIAKKNSYIHNPIAWALYHTWKRIEENR